MHPSVSRRRATYLAVAVVTGLGASNGYAQAPSNTRFDALVALTEAKMKEFSVPGVALGIIDGSSLTTRGLGVTTVEDSIPVNAHTVFPIASISKTFAATAMMRLVEQGKVDLRAPVRTYIPTFRVRDSTVSRDVTVWHLLTHMGGWEGQVGGPERGTATLENFVATTLPDLMQVAPPGKAWSYNNAGFSIAGRVIEVVTGKSINAAMRELVFQPLGLEHAGTTAGDFIVNRFAAGHTSRDGKTTLQRPFTPSSSVTQAASGSASPTSSRTRGSTWATARPPTASAFSTPSRSSSCASRRHTSRAPTTTSVSHGTSGAWDPFTRTHTAER